MLSLTDWYRLLFAVVETPSCHDRTVGGRHAANCGLAQKTRHVRICPALAENDVDVSVLRHLTDQDLKELGVSLGHRRKMLAAIAELAGVAPVTPQPAAPPEPKARDDAERRQLTVMFTDLVGSTALSTKRVP